MSIKENPIRMLGYVFIAIVMISSGLVVMNSTDYIYLLQSKDKVTFSIDEMLHRRKGGNISIALTFTLSNPTTYNRLMFSSLRCLFYIPTDGDNVFIGVKAFTPLTDVSLSPFDEWSYTTDITFPESKIEKIVKDPIESGIEWRVEIVVHFSTPIRKYYQKMSFEQISIFEVSSS